MLFLLYFCQSLRTHNVFCSLLQFCKNNQPLVILHIAILLSSAIRLIFSSEKATLGVDFTITCVSNVRAIYFRRDVTNERTIAGGQSNGTCNFIGEYNHNYKYDCNNSTGEYMYNLTIPSSFNINTLHGSRWICSAPIEVVSSETIQLYANGKSERHYKYKYHRFNSRTTKTNC